jgi:hypothetical protein
LNKKVSKNTQKSIKVQNIQNVHFILSSINLIFGWQLRIEKESKCFQNLYFDTILNIERKLLNYFTYIDLCMIYRKMLEIIMFYYV